MRARATALDALGVKITELTKEHAEYFGVEVAWPYSQSTTATDMGAAPLE